MDPRTASGDVGVQSRLHIGIQCNLLAIDAIGAVVGHDPSEIRKFFGILPQLHVVLHLHHRDQAIKLVHDTLQQRMRNDLAQGRSGEEITTRFQARDRTMNRTQEVGIFRGVFRGFLGGAKVSEDVRRH